MKTDTHPTYHAKTATKCACGATFAFGSTVEAIETEVCSACHPFYTGKQKLVDTAGKVDKFRMKLERAKAGAGKKKSEISESVRAAAASRSGDTSALGSKKLVGKVKAGRLKAEEAAAKEQEAKAKAKEDAKNVKVEDSPESKDATKTEPAKKAATDSAKSEKDATPAEEKAEDKKD